MEIITTGEKQTEKLGQNFAKILKAGDIVALFGDLGAGKSVFARGIARGLGIVEKIASPTYVFIKTHERGKIILHHIDLYRAEGPQVLEGLGLEEILDDNNSIVVVEWAQKIDQILPKKTIKVYIEKIDDEKRRIKITSRHSGERSDTRIKTSRFWTSSPRFASEAGQNDNKASHVIPTSSPSVIPNSFRDLDKAAAILKSGGVVIFPTDTVYGVGCVFDESKAIERIYKIKGRPKDQSFPILISSINQAKTVAKINPAAKKLMKKHWPGGLTIILLSRHPQPTTSVIARIRRKPETKQSVSKVGLRMPDSELVQTLIAKVGKPIIGTSANFHGEKSPENYESLDPAFIKLTDFVIKGECKLGEQSTVVDATVDPPKILRQGAVILR